MDRDPESVLEQVAALVPEWILELIREYKPELGVEYTYILLDW